MNYEQRAAILSASDQVPLTTEEVGAAIQVAPATLRKWASRRAEGDLVPTLKRAGRNYYRASDVRRWLGLEANS